MIASLRNRYAQRASELIAPSCHVHFATSPCHDGGPHIEFQGSDYHFVVTERGAEYERRVTTDQVEALIWLISDLTRAMAAEWELHHRIEGEGFRKHVDQICRVRSD